MHTDIQTPDIFPLAEQYSMASGAQRASAPDVYEPILLPTLYLRTIAGSAGIAISPYLCSPAGTLSLAAYSVLASGCTCFGSTLQSSLGWPSNTFDVPALSVQAFLSFFSETLLFCIAGKSDQIPGEGSTPHRKHEPLSIASPGKILMSRILAWGKGMLAGLRILYTASRPSFCRLAYKQLQDCIRRKPFAYTASFVQSPNSRAHACTTCLSKTWIRQNLLRFSCCPTNSRMVIAEGVSSAARLSSILPDFGLKPLCNGGFSHVS